MRTKLHKINLPESDECKKDLREKVKMKQIKMKEYTDKHRSALQTNFQPGSKVRVKKPWMIKKGDQRYTKPQKVMKKTGPNTYLLEDGRNWNAACISAIPDSVPVKTLDEALRVSPPSSERVIADNTVIRASRQRNPPSWMKDFVT